MAGNEIGRATSKGTASSVQSANICIINGSDYKFEFGYDNIFVPEDNPDG